MRDTCKTRRERVDSLNFFNDTVFFVFFATKHVVLLIEAVPVSTPYCLPYVLNTSNQMSRFGEAQPGSRVYRRKEQYKRQDHPMGNTEKTCSIINTSVHCLEYV